MSEFDGIRKTRLKSAPVINPNESITQGFFQFASEASAMSQQFGAEAKNEAAKAGQMAGQNSVSMNANGTITRSAVQDAGKFYTEAYMGAQRTAAKGALETNIRQETQKFLIDHQNDPKALDKFHEEFRKGYLDPLLKGLHQDISGQVGLVAEQVFKGGINTINDRDVQRRHTESVKVFKDTFDSDTKILRDLYRAGATEQAEALEQKIYGDMGDASQSFLTISGIEVANKEIVKARIGGELLAETENMDPFSGLERLRKFEETERKDGLGYSDRVELAQEAETQIKNRLTAINQQYDIAAAIAAPRLRAVDNILAQERLALPLNGTLPMSRIREAFKEAGFDNPEADVTAPSFYKQLGITKDRKDRLLEDRTTTAVQAEVQKIATGEVSVDAALNGPFSNYYSQTNIRALNEAGYQRATALMKIQENIDAAWVKENLIKTGQIGAVQIDRFVKEDPTGIYAKNYKEFIKEVVTYKTSDTHLAKLAQEQINAGIPVSENLGPSVDAMSLKNNYDGAFDPTNPEHMGNALDEALVQQRLPSYLSKALSNWETLLPNQEAMQAITFAYDKFDDKIGASLFPSSLRTSMKTIKRFITAESDTYKTAVTRLYSDDSESTRINLNEKYYGDDGTDQSKHINDIVVGELNNIVENTSAAGDLTADMIGNSRVIKRLLFGANFGRLEGEGITPGELSGMFGTEAAPTTKAFMERLNEQMYVLEAAGHADPLGKALTMMEAQGSGMSRLASFGSTRQMVNTSFEQRVKNFIPDPSISATDVLKVEIKRQIPEIVKLANGDDFGPDGIWGRLFRQTLGTEIEDQMGMGSGRKDDVKTMMDNVRFKKLVIDGDIKVSAIDPSQNVFMVQLRLGAKKPNGQRRVINLPNYIRLDEGTMVALSKDVVQNERRVPEIERPIRDPGKAIIDALDFSRYDPAKAAENRQKFRVLQEILREQTELLQDVEEPMP